MTFTVIDAEQRSAEWHQARVGLLTGSHAAEMLAQGRGKEPSVTKTKLRVRLALERLAGRPLETSFYSPWLLQGQERELATEGAYEALTGTVLTRSGFLRHKDLMAGCSLDGHLADFSGIVEYKNPMPHVHLETLRRKTVPPEYIPQIQHGLWLTGAEWCDWVSRNPDLPEELQTFIVRVWAKDADLKRYDAEARQFLAEVEAELAAVKGLIHG